MCLKAHSYDVKVYSAPRVSFFANLKACNAAECNVPEQHVCTNITNPIVLDHKCLDLKRKQPFCILHVKPPTQFFPKPISYRLSPLWTVSIPPNSKSRKCNFRVGEEQEDVPRMIWIYHDGPGTFWGSLPSSRGVFRVACARYGHQM